MATEGLLVKAVLGAAGTGLAVVVAYVMSDGGKSEVVEPVKRQRTIVAQAATTPPTATDASGPRAPGSLPSRREFPAQSKADPFGAVSFVPPPPPPPPEVKVVPPPPPEPTAPPLPFSFVGGMEDKAATRPTIFLSRGERLLIVGRGDVIDNTYRIESIGPREVVFTYLPLNQRQVLPMTGS